MLQSMLALCNGQIRGVNISYYLNIYCWFLCFCYYLWYIYINERQMSGISLTFSPNYVLRQALSTEYTACPSASLASLFTQGLPDSSAWESHHTYQAFAWVLGNPNSGPEACTASKLSPSIISFLLAYVESQTKGLHGDSFRQADKCAPFSEVIETAPQAGAHKPISLSLPPNTFSEIILIN